MKQPLHKLILGLGLLAYVNSAQAAVSVSWTSPPDGSSDFVGTMVKPVGQANARGSTGSGLDLALVLDSSGSMGNPSGLGNTRREAQAAAAKALVNNLPTGTTSVSIIEFDSDANIVTGLTPLIPAANITALENAIDGVDSSGGTDIRDGIVAGTGVLTGGGHTAGRSQQMVVISDGGSSQTAAVNAATAAVGAGVDSVHTVAFPGSSTGTMDAVATAGNGTFTDLSGGLNDLIAIFDGTGGNLVGIDQVDVTMPDGTLHTDVPVDALGNFMAPSPFPLEPGANTWTAKAIATNGDMASATVTVFGNERPTGVPDTGATLALLGLGLIGIASARVTNKPA